MADNSHVLRAGWQHARSGCAQTAEHRTCPLAPHTGHSPCSSMQWSNRMRPRRRRSRRHRHTASKDAMVTLDVTVLDAMPAEELSRPARKVHASSVGGRRTKGRPGRCSWARATLASGTARACLLHAVARPCWSPCFMPCALGTSAQAQLAGVAEAVMPASEHICSQSVHGTQAGVKRGSSAVGRPAQEVRQRAGLGVGLGSICSEGVQTNHNGRRPPLSGACALYEPHTAGGRPAPPYEPHTPSCMNLIRCMRGLFIYDS
jgi:hypothetical protein